jgi:filamentous hemagglutinin family protein
MNQTSAVLIRTLLLGTSCLSVLAAAPAQADPTGGNVVFGQAAISSHGATTTIDQKSGKAIINWDSFSIAAGSTVRFNQPGAGAIALNRVLGSESSAIYGSLLANGQVWLINGNGILFGGGSKINVGGLIATTSDIANGDFASGSYNFSNASGASVVNQGTIRTRSGGSAVLSGASVSNQGLISADAGTVVLGGAAAFTVDFVGDNLIRYAITAPPAKADNGAATGVSNSGTISAAGGRVLMTARAAANVTDAVVNNTGMISATSAKLQNGEVVLDGGDGDVVAGGTIDASGTASGQTGGSVAITGRNVTVADNARIDVSGDSGGGTVSIGGDLHGAGPLADADNTHVGSATIKADAIRKGKGGTLVVWSNGLTDFSGIFSAKGGLLGGDGGLVETSGHILNVAPTATVDTTAPKGQTGTWLLDPDTIVIEAGEGSGTAIPPGGTLAVGTDSDSTDYVRPSTIIAALSTTNVTLEASNYIEVDSPVVYASSNTLSLMSEGDISLYASIQNTQAVGGGGINLVAGWDGVTAPGALLSTPNSYGANDGEVFLDSYDADVFVGSASGTTQAFGAYVSLFAEDGGNVQLGYHGAGGGNINVFTTADVSLSGEEPGDGATSVLIGNGALDGSVDGAVTGNIFVSAAGTLYLATQGGGGGGGCDCDEKSGDAETFGMSATIGIGNAGGTGGPSPTGNVVVLAGDLNDEDDDNGGFGAVISNDLGYGDFTFGQTDSEAAIRIVDPLEVNSDHNLTLLAAGDIEIASSLQNAGGGAITLVAGWDGVYDPARIGVAGTYGNNDGSITIGSDDADSDASVGAAHGALNLYGAGLDLDAVNGYAQAGYHGAGGGNIFIQMTSGVSVLGGDDTAAEYAQIGNGSLNNDITGNVTGNISLNDGGQTVFFNGNAGLAWLGNVAGTGSSETGDLTMITNSGFFRADFIAADLGTAPGTGGNVFIGFPDPEVTPLFIGGFHYSSPNSFTFAGAGSMNVTGGVQNAGTGAVSLVAGWDGFTVGTGAQLLAAHAYGLNNAFMAFGNDDQFEDVAVGSAGGLTTILSGSITVAPADGFYAQIGYHGSGGGNIKIATTGDLTLTPGSTADDYAMIGNGSLNGDVTGNITGNIDVSVGGATRFDSVEGGTQAWLGNVAGTGASETGNVQIVTFDFDSAQEFATVVISDLAGGDVTIGITDANSAEEIGGAGGYNSAHTLDILTAGSLAIGGSIQNGGSGAINILAGWDGVTLDAAHFADTGVFGNHGGSILIGGSNATGNVAVGSSGGQTNIAAASLVLSGVNGYAQLGYHGTGSGTITVNTTGVVTLAGGANAADFAQIGSGASFGSNAGSGDVSVSAASIAASGNQAVTAANLKLAAASGGIANSANALRIASATLALQTNGGAVFLTSPGNGVTFGGSGVNLAGGALTLTAGGAIAQTAAIHTGSLSVATTTGAIALTNAGNSFGALTVTTTGSDNAAFAHSTVLSVASANVGGTLTLSAGGNISQSGAIHAAGLNVASSGGTIVLTNTGNAFATLAVSTTGGNLASLTDSTAVALGASTVGGTLTLTGGGAITQTAAIHAANLTVATTSGAITLTNTGNSFGALTVTTAGTDNASFANSGALAVASASVGGTLTLTAGGAITQTAAIHAANLTVATTSGAITLTNAGNSFGALTVTTAGTDSASFANSGALAIASASVGGTLTLSAGGNISQSGAIHAAALSVSSSGGTITLLNTGNTFATLAVSTTGSNAAALTDSTAVALGTVTVGGTLTLAAGGAVTQTAALTAANLAVSTTSGAITLANAANAVGGTVQFNGAGAVSFADASTLNVGAIAAGGDVTLLSKGNVNIFGGIQLVTGNLAIVAGWDGTTTAPSAFGNTGVYGNNSGSVVIGGGSATGNVAAGSRAGTTSVYAANVSVLAVHGVAQLGYHGTGGGNIKVAALQNLTLTGSSAGSAMIGNGSFGSDVTGNVTGDIDIRVGGSAAFNSSDATTQAWIGDKTASGSQTGNLIMLAADYNGSQDCDVGCFAQADIVGGDVTLGVSGTTDRTLDGTIAYNSAHTLNLLIGGGVTVTGTLQNAGTGAINLVAGWDGHTLSGFGTAGVFGNNAKGITIGGTGAAGNAAFGSAGGTTSIYGASLALTASNGYAQLGFNGHGTGAIVVDVTGNVTLSGGATAGQFAQIGNGGLKASGSNNGDIAITAGGDVILTAGAGSEAYAQIGHGGAESNTSSSGYSNVAAIAVNATNVTLHAGTGAAAYVQIGNGGYKSGIGITGGTATNGGAITITASHAVSLLGGSADAYAQIGNGGSQSNLNASASAGGADSGDIVVTAPNGGAGAVTLAAGGGNNAYAQIGNGGYAVNAGATSTAANWTVTGNVTVTDLSLSGGDGGGNEYSQIGNGDASNNAVGNVSGNITINANGQVTYTNGTAPHSTATIGNFTGQGTTSGTLTGAQPPSAVTTDPVVIGTIAANTANNGSGNDNITTINTVVVAPTTTESGPTTTVTASLATATPGPLAAMDNGGDSSTPNTADSATVVIADSLDGAKKAPGSQTILAGMLRQAAPASNTVHGVPPVDQDFSSWGNEALWQ